MKCPSIRLMRNWLTHACGSVTISGSLVKWIGEKGWQP